MRKSNKTTKKTIYMTRKCSKQCIRNAIKDIYREIKGGREKDAKTFHTLYLFLFSALSWQITLRHAQAITKEYLVSISPTFSAQLFRKKVLHGVFLYLIFGLFVFGARVLPQKLLLKCWWNWHLVNLTKS